MSRINRNCQLAETASPCAKAASSCCFESAAAAAAANTATSSSSRNNSNHAMVVAANNTANTRNGNNGNHRRMSTNVFSPRERLDAAFQSDFDMMRPVMAYNNVENIPTYRAD